ncbi:MAG: CoA transferase, partial [Chloroflexi bacterium]|nr:CoA transferase [Chloroflexota bacterium]
PGTMEGLGLGYEARARSNPRLVYCSLPPWGERGPLRDAPGSEALVAAYSGLLNGQAPARDGPGVEPLPMVSYGTALLAAYGVSAALYVREQHTGRGQRVLVPLLNGSLAMQSAASVWMQGIVRLGQQVRNPYGAIPVYRLYRCADDWVFLGCGNPQFWGKLCIALDRLDLMADPRFEGAPWGMKIEDFPALSAELEPIFRTRTAAEWLRFLEEHDIPCAPVQTREEFADDPQVRHSQMMVTVQDPDAGPVRMMGVPVKLRETPGAVAGPAPRAGQHTKEVLAEAGLTHQEVASLLRRGIVAQA